MTTAGEEDPHQDQAYIMAGADTLADHSGCFEPEAVQPPMRSCPMAEVDIDHQGDPRP